MYNLDISRWMKSIEPQTWKKSHNSNGWGDSLDWHRWVDGVRKEDVLKGLAAGVVGGLVGTIVMTQFQNLVTSMASRRNNQGPSNEDSAEGGVSSGDDQEPATVTAARNVHYGFGTTMGGVYGAVAEVAPTVTIGEGLVFGTALMLVADELVVPAARLSPPPTEVPPSSHAYALASHLVYGFTTEMVRKYVRNVL
jgi:uncharacterized membrane protein YagU involved in acid resistance